MKVDVFKKLIKESVREVLREELSSLQVQQPIQENRNEFLLHKILIW
jgi:hypothetical protein